MKYFQEKAPEFHVIAAGSLLGISLGRDTSFPVGKVNFLTIYPLSYSEYLRAIGDELLLDTLIHHHVSESLAEALHLKLLPTKLEQLFWTFDIKTILPKVTYRGLFLLDWMVVSLLG